MPDTLFFSPTTVTSLMKTTYKFKERHLQDHVQNFKREMRAAEQELLSKGIKYMPLDKISASIQF